jgi:periplasmic protein TonB
MSYRALLFCPDETAARLVTQVLSELDFTVELSFEPFVTVKELTDEPFEALVVDCGDEQNASLIFKGARNSSLNHSSLCVAVVEGQMGVAKAFRIGANLVLTKPINIEQSKATLRVARGLLRKNEHKPRTASEPAGTTSQTAASMPSSLVAGPLPAPVGIAAPVPSPPQPNPVRTTAVPSSLFDAEQEKRPSPESDRVAPATSMPSFLISKPAPVEPSVMPASKSADRFAGGNSTSTGAAAVMAPQRTRSVPTTESETKVATQIKTAPPLATQDTIVPQTRFPEPAAARVPVFASYAQHSSTASARGNRIFWLFLCLLVLGPAGYFGWQKLQPLRYLHRPFPATNKTEETSPSPQPVAADTTPTPVNSAPAEQQNSAPSIAGAASSDSPAPNSPNAAPEGFPTKESIEVDAPISVVPKPQPFQVNPKSEASSSVRAEPTPPSIVLPESNASDSALAGIVSTNVVVPKAMPGTLQLSQGVSQGLIIKKIAPVYPAGALQLRKQGAVELLATVSKEGAITKVKVLSGDSMLAQAAVNAVRQWKYRPFLLNAEPVQIETQITINFRLPN